VKYGGSPVHPPSRDSCRFARGTIGTPHGQDGRLVAARGLKKGGIALVRQSPNPLTGDWPTNWPPTAPLESTRASSLGAEERRGRLGTIARIEQLINVATLGIRRPRRVLRQPALLNISGPNRARISLPQVYSDSTEPPGGFRSYP